MKSKQTVLLFIAMLSFALFLFSGCSDDVPEKKVDSFIRCVVVEKTTDSTLKAVHLPDTLDEDTILFTITLRPDPEKKRPLSIISEYMGVGTNVAFKYLTETGTKYMLDNIATMTTSDFVILDRPDEFDRLARVAQKMKRKKLLDEKKELKALREAYQKVTLPQHPQQ